MNGVPIPSSLGSPYGRRVPREMRENMKWRRAALRLAARSPAARRDLKAKCAADLLFYANTFCWTYDPRNVSLGLPTSVPFTTWPFQDETLLAVTGCVLDGRDVAIAKSRDMGASWMNVLVLEWLWHFRDGLSFLMVSRNERYVDETGNPDSLFWKIDFLHRHQPRWLLPKGRELGEKDPLRRQGHLGNAETGSVIDGEATTGNIGRGGRRTAALIDEFAAFDVKDGFATLAATRDMTPCRIFNSTPRGVGNAFHKVAREVPGVLSIDLHWTRHPRKARGLYRMAPGDAAPELLDGWCGEVRVFDRSGGERRVRFPEAYPFVADGKTRSPWYDAQCARCATPAEVGQELDIDFLGSDCQFFDAAAIEALRLWGCRPPERTGTLSFHADTLAPLAFHDEPGGRLRLWLDLGREDAPPMGDYVMGVDVAAGTGASNSAVAVYDRATGEKVAEYADPAILPADLARFCAALGAWFHDALVVPDRSGPTGEVFVKTLLAAGYGRLWYRPRDPLSRTSGSEPGVWLNPQAKTACLEEYRDALARRRIVNRSETALGECLQFVRRMDGTIEHSAALTAADPGGARAAHGDLVIADALAALALADLRRLRDDGAPPAEIPSGSVAARMAEAGAGRFAPPPPDPEALGDKWNP